MTSFADETEIQTENETETPSTQSEDSNILIRGNHPRKDNLWLQYFPLTTALRKNVVISEIGAET